ncbi:MAG: type IV pili twitching motility protein PilT, partial [Patescibacteria group bacterium]
MKDYAKELKDLILTTIKEGASDLHITVGRHPTIRVSGSLIPLLKNPILSAEDAEGLILSMLNEKDGKILKEQKEYDFSYSFEDKSRFRVNAFTQRGYLGAALRLISNKAKTIKELNLPDILSDFAKKEHLPVILIGHVTK